jgi:hypothetical protein
VSEGKSKFLGGNRRGKNGHNVSSAEKGGNTWLLRYTKEAWAMLMLQRSL